jgi:GNAT superfamily N-acetyltransferase
MALVGVAGEMRRRMKSPHPGVTFRLLTTADLAAADQLREFAGWNQTPRDWQGYLEYEPAGCLAAEVDGRVVGTASTITYGRDVGWIGMVLVHPEQRRHGIGSALLNRCLDLLRARGIRSIKLDATPMGRTVYLPMGFVDEYELSRFQGTAGPEPAADRSLLEPLSAAAWADLVTFDAEIFGVARPAVLRSLASREPESCFVVRNGGVIRGYLMARTGRNAVQVGPWLARDDAAAAALLAGVVRRHAGKRMFIDVPAPNVAGTALMREIGFSVQRGYVRMFLGENPRPGMPECVFSTSGAEKG